jgi:hypothetical protein
MIVWSLFENGYKQCGDTPIGTYVTAVPNFLNGLMNQKAQDAEDQGQDFDYPDAAQYIACMAYEINNNNYYLQFGCSDETSQAVTINIFDDNACTKPSSVDRSAIDEFDVSSVQVRHWSFSTSFVSFIGLASALNEFFYNIYSLHLSNAQCAFIGLIGMMINQKWMMDFTMNGKRTHHYVPFHGPIGKRVIQNVNILGWKRNSEKDLVHPIMSC